MTRVYYKEAVGALVVFDVTRVSTFEAVTKWKTDIDTKVVLPDGKPIPVVLLANKVCEHWHTLIPANPAADASLPRWASYPLLCVGCLACLVLLRHRFPLPFSLNFHLFSL